MSGKMSGAPAHRSRAQIFLAVLLALTAVFIFGNSLLPKRVSKAISAAVTIALGGEPEPEPPEDECPKKQGPRGPEYYIRKAAHLLEFAALGAEVALLLALCGREGKRALPPLLAVGVAASLLDETLQIFSSRGPLVSDIWIDIAGFTIGAGVALLLRKAYTRRRAKITPA